MRKLLSKLVLPMVLLGASSVPAAAQVLSYDQSVSVRDLHNNPVADASSSTYGAISAGAPPSHGGLGGPGGLGGTPGYAATSITVRPDVQLSATAIGGTDSAFASAQISYYAYVVGAPLGDIVPLHLIGAYDMSSDGAGQATVKITTEALAAGFVDSFPNVIDQACNRGRGACGDDQHFDLAFNIGYPVPGDSGDVDVLYEKITLLTSASVFEESPLGNNAFAFIDPIVTIDAAYLASHPGVSVKLAAGLGNSFAAAGGVPEPASWALMIAGFGLAGAALRRRRTALA